jgi:pimeloyl-ACP methyl ester carboxylesterase
MAIFVIAHGAWAAGWSWKKMRPLMAARGHELFTPSYTGIGERAHLASPDIDLETHIADVLGVLDYEDLRGVVLIGHSYGGMVATGVADRARERIARLIYLDAFAPNDGDSAFSLNPERAAHMREAAGKNGGFIPPNPMAPDVLEADKAWAVPKRVPQPLKTFEQPLRLRNGPLTLPRHYIYCRRHMPGDPFRQFLERARREGWGASEIESGHHPHITMPEGLTDLLHAIATERVKAAAAG